MKALTMKWLKNKIGMNIDFRRDVYAPNKSGAYPQMSYERAKAIVEKAHRVIEEEIGGLFHWYSIELEIGCLETTPLKTKLENYLFLAQRTIEQKIKKDKQ